MAPKRVTVNAVLPALIETDILKARYNDPERRKGLLERIPVGRIGQPEDVAYICGQHIITDGRADKYVSFRMTRALHDRIVEKYEGVLCSDVQTKLYGRVYDLRKDEDKQAFRDAGAQHDDDKCCMAVGDGARWGMELLLDEIEAQGKTLEDFRDADGNQKEPE